MGLLPTTKKCWNCNQDLPLKNPTCGSCGAANGSIKSNGIARTPNEEKIFKIKFGVGFACVIGISVLFQKPWNKPNSVDTSQIQVPDQKPPVTPEEARKQRIENLFSAWDGSLPKLERLIKKSMNDPDSYKHVETSYWDMNTHLVVKTTFRGKNGFGGVITSYVKAKVDLDGNVLEVIEQM